MRWSIPFAALGVLSLVCRGVAAPAPAASSYKAPEGAYSVAVTDDVTVHDARRNKDLSLKVYAPDAPGRFPVIVFSHGAGGSKAAFAPLARYWATHGFVSIHPSHADALTGGSLTGAGESPRGALGGLLARTLNSPAAWTNRARDISSVIDGLDQVEKAVPALQGRLDRKRIGVGGHSFGAFTAMLIGGATVDLSEGEKDRAFLDPRVRAILVVSGQGTGQQGLTERSWKNVFLPMMTVTGSADRGVAGQGPEWKKQPFDLSRPGNKYHLFLQGASHFSFGGELAGGGPAAGGLGPGVRARLSGGRRVGFGGGLAGAQDTVFEAMKSASLAFWNAYLKDDDQAKAFLTSGRLSALTQGKATLSHR
jgi:predicted dienelactone hydrolase